MIDSDTRVPVDCFMDAALEMTQSPQVAIIQHASGVMQVAHHFFENGQSHLMPVPAGITTHKQVCASSLA